MATTEIAKINEPVFNTQGVQLAEGVFVKLISVELEGKFNMDDYESRSFRMAAFADLREGTTPQEGQAKLWAYVNDAVKAQAMPHLVRREQKRRMLVGDVLAGLPKQLQALASGLMQSVFNVDSTTVQVVSSKKEKEEGSKEHAD